MGRLDAGSVENGAGLGNIFHFRTESKPSGDDALRFR
jgi:hypothetical protein